MTCLFFSVGRAAQIDLGTYGRTWSIEERDLLELVRARAQRAWESGEWHATWADSSTDGRETWQGMSAPGRITFRRTSADASHEVEYWVDDQGAFRWEQRESSDGTSWRVTQRAEGKKQTP